MNAVSASELQGKRKAPCLFSQAFELVIHIHGKALAQPGSELPPARKNFAGTRGGAGMGAGAAAESLRPVMARSAALAVRRGRWLLNKTSDEEQSLPRISPI